MHWGFYLIFQLRLGSKNPKTPVPQNLLPINSNIKPLFKNSEHINFIKDAMFASSNEPGGTSYRSRIDNPKYQFAGKTGTAQVKRISKRERELDWEKNIIF